MTNNHLYCTVTTILQEQSGTRRAEVTHLIVASLTDCSIRVFMIYLYSVFLGSTAVMITVWI